MPKIDLSAVPVFDRLVYPAGLRAETAAISKNALEMPADWTSLA